MKPAFLTAPDRWNRSPRTSASAVDLACAVQRHVPVHRNDHIVMIGCAVALVAALVLIAVGWVQ